MKLDRVAEEPSPRFKESDCDPHFIPRQACPIFLRRTNAAPRLNEIENMYYIFYLPYVLRQPTCCFVMPEAFQLHSIIFKGLDNVPHFNFR